MKKRIIALLLFVILTLTACGPVNPGPGGNRPNDPNQNNPGSNITDDNTSYGDDIGDLGALDGVFEGEGVDVKITCVEGTPGCYKIEGNTVIFSGITTDSVYSISGKLSGNIVISVPDAYNLELEMCGFSMISDSTHPISVMGGNEVTLQAKKDTKNYIYDNRAAIAEDDDTSISGAIYSEVDLEISGKGELYVVSYNNNGIHSKKDLQVKNLTLTVSCKNNALKGNDSVELENATATIIASKGDCIKTSNSDVSNKGNQRGIVSILGGSYDIYAACDAIDAAYDVVISGSDTVVNIYTDRYSNYSEEVVSVSKQIYYIRSSNNNYKYSVKYYNSDDDYKWVNAEYHSTIPGFRNQYYYYSFEKDTSYAKIQIFAYSSGMEQGQEQNYALCSELITPNTAFDTVALTVSGSSIRIDDWTNYGVTGTGGKPGGPGMPGGGMQEGNSDKGDHSTKGIKSDNDIVINDGTVNIKSYDDAIHAKSGVALENGATSTGNVTVSGGNITLYSNDDGVHADNNLVVNGGNLNIIKSYEGMEGTNVKILGGNVSVIAVDDGINGTASSGAAITIGGGTLYVYCGGDGIDSNSRTSYGGIVFSGGKTLIISTSNGNSAIDSEAGYNYTAGSVVAVMPKGGMSGEASKCQNFASLGKTVNLSLTKGNCLTCEIGGAKLTVNMPATISAYIVILGSSSATASVGSSSHTLSEGEFIWE